MLSRKAMQLSDALARRGIINEEDTAVYSYGLELMMSTVLNILLIILVSVLFGEPLAWILFLLPFIPLRLTAGGYHAKTHLGCGITFTAGYAGLLATGIYTAALVTPVILIAVAAAGFIINLLLSPVPSSNKPLTPEEKGRNRRRSLAISAACLLVTAASLFPGAGWMPLFTWFVLGQFGAAASLIAAKLVRD